MIGQTVSHYKILEKLGEGGMGEVYLAQDSGPLGREVALKFVSREMQEDPAAKRRFLREAKLAAALDHPYVCHIHEVGEDGDQSFIAMEYVAGQSLKDRLAKGPLELKDVLQKAMEIAEALEAAHRQKIVHRDLKPANIMLTPEGHVKVMDFGLAKRLVPAEGSEIHDETVSSLTEAGATLGALPYMSPEQVRGQEVDSRSDIFSFGVVLYEMLTGVHPFKKDTAVETANAILNDLPAPLVKHIESAPMLLQHTVRKMLAKDPVRRYQSIHEVETNLRAILEGGEDSSESAAVVEQSRKAWVPWLITVSALLVAGSLGFWTLRQELPPGVIKHVTLNLPSDYDPQTPGVRLAASPVGQDLVYLGVERGVRRIYHRRLDQRETRAIAETQRKSALFFSADGKWVGFQADNQLKKVSLAGGPPQIICDVRGIDVLGVTWGADDRIIFGTTGTGGLYEVSAQGGATPRNITTPNVEENELEHF